MCDDVPRIRQTGASSLGCLCDRSAWIAEFSLGPKDGGSIYIASPTEKEANIFPHAARRIVATQWRSSAIAR
jgi:hypothetical protein